MKKSLWGYNVQEVDESMELLESANGKLEKKVKALTAELESVRTELTEAKSRLMTSENVNHSDEYENMYRESAKEAAALKKEVASLTQKNTQMAQQIASYDEQSMKGAVEQAGAICRAAYEDMANAKSNSKAALESFLESFWENFEQYEQRIRELYEEIMKAHSDSREDFLHAADEILTNYAAIRERNESMSRRLSEIDEMKDSVRKEIEAVLDELSGQERTEGVESVEELSKQDAEETGEKYKYPILQELAAMRKEHQKILQQEKEERSRVPAQQTATAQIRPIAASFAPANAAVSKEATDFNDKSGAKDGEEVRVGITMNVDKKNIV